MELKDERLKIIPKDKILLNDVVHACVVVKDVEKTAKNICPKDSASDPSR